MQLSTSTNIYFNRPDGKKANLEETIRLCSNAGYKVLDFNFHDASNFDTPFKTENWREWLESLLIVANKNDIKFKYGHAHFYEFCDHNVKNRSFKDELVRRSIVGASILGIKWLVIHACTDFNSAELVKDSKLATIEYMRPYLKLAEELNVGICFENLWELSISPKRRYTTTAEELVDLVDTLSMEFTNVGICWDFEHSGIMEQDIKKEISLVGDRLKMVHISDFTSVNNDHILPFEGLIDWDRVLKALKKINYKGDLNYEIHRYTMNTPDSLVPSKLRYSFETGEYLIDRFMKIKL